MAEYTEHYNLELPASTEHYDIKVANTNNQIIDEKLYEKVDKIPNKGLSTNDFTNGYKQKLDDLKNYDDTQIKKDISNMKTEITAKDNVQDNKILQLQNEKAELEKELKEAQEDFYQNSIRGQASGEYIHVEDSSNCRARIGISGNQEQETRSGKNYYFIDDVETTTMSGITYSIKKGLITLNGTATGGIIIKSSTKFSLSSGDYIMSATKIQGSFTGTFGKYVSKNSEIIIDGGLIESTTKKKLASDYTELITHLYIAKGAVCNNYQVKIQLEKGTETSEWEQAGAMPSPDYLSEIKAVGDNVNLANLGEKAQYTSSGFTVSWEDSVFKMSGTASTNLTIPANVTGVTNAINLGNFKAGTYTVSKKILNGNVINAKGSGIYLRSSNGMIASIYIASIKDRASFTLTEDTNIYIYVFIDSETQYSDLEIGIKIAEGTEVGEYSKYGQGCVKVTKCNKNFLKNTAVSGELNGVNRTVKEDGSVIINGTSTKWANLTVGTIQGDGNSYILSGSPSNSEIFLTVNNTEEGDIAQSKNGSDAAFIPLKGSTYSVIVCIPSKKTFNNEVVKPLIRTVNDEDNTYIKHQEQSYIMPVQQEMLEGDYFDYDNEEEVHIFGKKVLTGNENWEAIGTNTSGKYRFQTKVDDIAFNADGDTYLEGICDSYKVGTPNTTYLCQESIATVQYYLIIYNEKVNDTVENFKKGLSNKNVTIYYKLATPIRLKFTDEQKAVAKELNNARTYKNVTNITTDSIAILDLDYAKDLEELTEYSTEERVIGRWIDGKPLYSKVGSIKFTSVYDSSGLHTRGSLIDSDIDYGTVSKVLNKNLLSSSLFNTYGTSTSNVYVENRQGNSNKGYILGFTDRTDLLNTTIYVVVEYTKTTD